MAGIICGGCQKRFKTEERLLEHQNDISPITACQKAGESKELLCGGCQKRFETKEGLLEHQFLNPHHKGGSMSGEQNQLLNQWAEEDKKREKEFQESLEKDRTVNPHLALISDHLWWLAFVAKLGLILMLISVGLSLIFMGG